MKTTTRTSVTLRRHVVTLVMACGTCAVTFAAAAADRSPPTGRRVVVDPEVTTAGGHGCRECDSGQCRLHGHCGHRHHPDCRNGMCVPYCPVRPSTFGFYGTQWRRWPGQGVVPASAEDATTPVPPPKSAVPGPDEESPMRPDETGERPEPQPDSGAEDRADTRDGVVVPDAEAPAEPIPPAKPRAPDDVVPEPKPALDEKKPAAPPGAPAPTKPAVPTAPQRLPSLDDILGGAETGPVPRAEPMPRDADGPTPPKATAPKAQQPIDMPDEDASPTDEPGPAAAPEDADTANPFEDDSTSASDPNVTLAGFRYPSAVGGSLEPGGRPWQLAPHTQKRQRATGSPRGR